MKEISNRCGLDSCEYNSPLEKVNCRIYTSRKDCPKSMRKRSKIANHSKRQEKKNWRNL